MRRRWLPATWTRRAKLTARVLWPTSVTLTKENHITAWCYCTLRRAWKSFRLDRIRSIHHLTTPDDAYDPEDAAAHGATDHHALPYGHRVVREAIAG